MADKKISELETATLADVIAAGGFVPVAVPNTGTLKVPVSEISPDGVRTFIARYEEGDIVWPDADDVVTAIYNGERVEIVC